MCFHRAYKAHLPFLRKSYHKKRKKLNSDCLFRIRQTILICSLFVSLFTSGLDANADNVLAQWDQQLFDRFYDTPPHNEPMWSIMDGISEAGHYRSIMGLSILLMAYGNEDHQETGRLLSSTYISAGAMTYGLKRLIT